MSSEEPVEAVILPEGPQRPVGNKKDDAGSEAFGCGCITAAITLLAIIPGGCGVYWSRSAQRDVGSVTLAQAEDRRATPSGSFVTLSGTPDPEHAVEIVGEGDDVGMTMFTLEGAPRLAIVCRANHPLSVIIRDDSDPAAFEKLDREWTFEGRLINGGDTMLDIPHFQIYRYVTEHLGLERVEDARVLIVGETAQSWVTKARWGYGFAAALGLLAAIGWVMTFRFWLAERAARSNT